MTTSGMRLRRVRHSGDVSELAPIRPKELIALVDSLDPNLDHHLELEGFDVSLRAWPCQTENDGLCALLSARRDDDRLWLGRVRDGAVHEVEGRQLPAHLVVPMGWVSSAIQSFVQGVEWPWHLPWHDDRVFKPVGTWRADAFSFERLANAGEDLREQLESLRGELLRMVVENHEPWRAFAETVAELRRLGHDLWSWDHRGDSEQWGHDYMRAAPGQGLRLEVRYEPDVLVGLSYGAVSLELPEEE